MNVEQAMIDSTSVFSRPAEGFELQTLSRHQKLKRLRRWEYDAHEVQVAEEENMAGGPLDLLDHVLKALHQLDAQINCEHSSPRKQGGELFNKPDRSVRASLIESNRNVPSSSLCIVGTSAIITVERNKVLKGANHGR